jgi:hypothetical protein
MLGTRSGVLLGTDTLQHRAELPYPDDYLAGLASYRATVSMVGFFHRQLSFDKSFQFSGIKELA